MSNICEHFKLRYSEITPKHTSPLGVSGKSYLAFSRRVNGILVCGLGGGRGWLAWLARHALEQAHTSARQAVACQPVRLYHSASRQSASQSVGGKVYLDGRSGLMALAAAAARGTRADHYAGGMAGCLRDGWCAAAA